MKKKPIESSVSGLVHELKMKLQIKKIFDGSEIAEVEVKNEHIESILRVKNDENFEYKYHYFIYEAILEKIPQIYIACETDNRMFPIKITIIRKGRMVGVWETTFENFLKIFKKK